ncbi:hypothetical protein [Halarsenatibacter silvermanii]|uniref:Uncharacterized protein n=1 Tax=Halarsenatibacter silvermanii TaxID=321763 RepID=A0A1G9P8A8_9FIRM|nr:hypothetical protein [Halarsenatibacter silvermanii]SDL95016.1 hypothetical protein SAMN04488692_11238 [Halarsenatibacter silvermanii]
MEVIGLTGSAGEGGKTDLGLMILENIRRKTGVLKGRVNKDSSRIVTEDPQIMRAESPGISPYLNSVAENVVLLQSSPADLKSAIDEAYRCFSDLDYLLVEGDRLILSLDPGLIIQIMEEGVENESLPEVKQNPDLIVKNYEIYRSTDLNDINIELPADEISCYRAQLISDLLGRGYGEFGRKLNREGIQVRRCQLGLFK